MTRGIAKRLERLEERLLLEATAQGIRVDFVEPGGEIVRTLEIRLPPRVTYRNAKGARVRPV